MPIYNALADRPTNMLAYPDALRATPRNEYLGALADLIAQSYSPQRTQQMQGTARFLSMPAISQTLDRLSYGEPLTTGAGGLGGTTRIRPEALEAGMAVAPMAQPVTMASLQAARAARQAALQAGRAGERYAERVVPQIMERGGLPAEMLNALANRTASPLTVWHGSPHRFPPTERNPLGEFDASKIGTGEGAQVYGHGLYTAEAPAVATEYKNQLGTQMKYKGEQFYDPIVGKKTGTTGNTELDDYLLSYLGDTGVIRKELLSAAKEMRSAKNPQAVKEYQALMGELRKVRSDVTAANTGSLYKVDLPDEQIAKMLDYDKTWKQQPKNVQDAINVDKLLKYYGTDDISTSQVLYHAKQNMSPAAFAEFLRSKGVPGVKYFDEKSRAAGEGTRNFVIFPGEEKSMTILERNGESANALVKNKKP
jgi:hypothetical protein